MTRWFRNLKIIFAVVFLVITIFIVPVFASQGSAQTAIDSAQSAIKNCYDSVKQAEAAGANVDALLVNLNDAAGLLSKAELAYASNDYDSAFNYASQSKNKLNDFIPQANTLRENALQDNNKNFVWMILLLLVSVAILSGGIAGWVVLNRKERRNFNGAPAV